jgi:hypothetical protein
MMRLEASIDERILIRLGIEHSDLTVGSLDGEALG